jgi:hypothetical protein
MSQLNLFDQPPKPPRFNGSDYVPERDDIRLGEQLARIWNVMKDSEWRTLNQIADITGDPPASISAQLRHLKKDRFGKHTLNKEYLGNGLYRYQIIPSGRKVMCDE